MAADKMFFALPLELFFFSHTRRKCGSEINQLVHLLD
jgi:hypothetical protein